MAQATASSLCFKSIKIHQNQILGVGAYGTVCRATCDNLQCAAKVLHPNLILPADQAQQVTEPHKLPIRRFEQECKFLSLIRHPNIILFLGMSQDAANGLPVLLMELMDENLTTFLERDAQAQLPFCTQVRICCDVSAALSFLHSNEIYHRDLSSNNVLMIGDRRAKITDFGMAVFENAHRKKTEVPGTAVYMPPEVKGSNPISCDKTDVFSFGVLSIQIITRLFPEPSTSVAYGIWRLVSGSETEIQNRKNHISLVSEDHPLLPVALECLTYKYKNRPTSSHVCRLIRSLKNLDYAIPVLPVPLDCHVPPADSEPQDFPGAYRQEGKKKRQENPASSLAARNRSQSIPSASGERYCLSETKKLVFEISTVHEISEIDAEQWDEISIAEAPHRLFTPPTCQVQDISGSAGISWQQRGQKTPDAMFRSADAVVLDGAVYVLHGTKHTCLHSFLPRHHKWSSHPPPPVEQGSLAVVNSKVVLVGGRNSNKLYSLSEEGWKNKLPSMHTRRHSAIIASSASYLIVIGGVGKAKKYLRLVEVLDIDDARWSTVMNFPEPCAGLSACICRGRVYVFGNLNCVYTSEVETLVTSRGISALADSVSGARAWECAQDLPVMSATCVVVSNTLYAVGGKLSHGGNTSAVYRYNESAKSWCVYAHMKAARSKCFAAMLSRPSTMVVVGGVTQAGGMFDTMETANWRV